MEMLADITEEPSFYPKLFATEQQIASDNKRLDYVMENLETNMDEATIAVYKSKEKILKLKRDRDAINTCLDELKNKMEEKESFSRLQDFRIRDYQLQLETEKEEHAKTKRKLEITKEKLTSMEKLLNYLTKANTRESRTSSEFPSILDHGMIVEDSTYRFSIESVTGVDLTALNIGMIDETKETMESSTANVEQQV